MQKFRKFFGRLRGETGEASATKRTVPEIVAATTTTERTVPTVANGTITPDAASLEQKAGPYSTEGSIGMRVVADPPGARLEYVQSRRYSNMKFTDQPFSPVSFLYMGSQAIAIRHGHTRTESSGQNS
jgi:hypothetical protein